MVQKGPDGAKGSQMVKKNTTISSLSLFQEKATWRMNLCSLQANNGSASVIVGIIHRGKPRSVVTHGQMLCNVIDDEGGVLSGRIINQSDIVMRKMHIQK